MSVPVGAAGRVGGVDGEVHALAIGGGVLPGEAAVEALRRKGGGEWVWNNGIDTAHTHKYTQNTHTHTHPQVQHTVLAAFCELPAQPRLKPCRVEVESMRTLKGDAECVCISCPW
jgi:hypothetical protein